MKLNNVYKAPGIIAVKHILSAQQIAAFMVFIVPRAWQPLINVTVKVCHTKADACKTGDLCIADLRVRYSCFPYYKF